LGRIYCYSPGGKEIVKADYYKEQLTKAEIDLKEVRHYRNILPEFKEEKIDLAIREFERRKQEKSEPPSF